MAKGGIGYVVGTKDTKFNSRYTAVQYLYKEVGIDPEFLNSFHNEDSIYLKKPDRIARATDLLIKRMNQLATKYFTDNQLIIWSMFKSGQYTQVDIAKELDLCQPTIYKILFGNDVYINGKPKKHGGCVTKLKKLSDKDWVSQFLLAVIADNDIDWAQIKAKTASDENRAYKPKAIAADLPPEIIKEIKDSKLSVEELVSIYCFPIRLITQIKYGS